jgi:hypothetical protein
LWTLDARLRDSEQKTEKLFKILQTKENIELGVSKLTDTTYKTNFGMPNSTATRVVKREEIVEPAPVKFKPDQPTYTHYSYSESQHVTINSKFFSISEQPNHWTDNYRGEPI